MRSFFPLPGAIAATALLCISQVGSAATVFSSNFNSDTVDAVPPAPFNGNLNQITVRAADSNFSTQYLELASTATGGFSFPFYDGVDGSASAVATFSFDGRFNTADFGSYARIRMRARPVGFTAGNNDITRVDIGNGGSAPTLDVNNHYDYIINNSAVTAAIEGLGGTIDAGEWVIYQNGAVLASGDVRTEGQGNPQGAAVDYMTLWVQGNNTDTQGIVRIDNFEVRNNAYAVPEPSVLGLISLGLLGLGIRRRK